MMSSPIFFANPGVDAFERYLFLQTMSPMELQGLSRSGTWTPMYLARFRMVSESGRLVPFSQDPTIPAVVFIFFASCCLVRQYLTRAFRMRSPRTSVCSWYSSS